jgi:hypothetical protein
MRVGAFVMPISLEFKKVFLKVKVSFTGILVSPPLAAAITSMSAL